MLTGLGFIFFVLALVFFGLWWTNTGIQERLQAVVALPQSSCPNDVNCLATSNRILQSADSTQDPCQSFYNFTCNGFTHRNFKPDLVTGKTRFVDKLQTTKDNALLRIFSGQRAAELTAGIIKTDPTLAPVLKAVTNYFNACVAVTGPNSKVNYIAQYTDADALKYQAIVNKTIATVTQNLNDRFLSIDSSSADARTTAYVNLWQNSPNTLGQIRQLDTTGAGIFPTGLFDVVIFGDYTPYFTPSVVVVPPNVPVPASTFTDSAASAQYKTAISTIVTSYMFPGLKDAARVNTYVSKIYNFEQMLSEIVTPRPTGVGSDWQPVSLDSLESNFSSIFGQTNGMYTFLGKLSLPADVLASAKSQPSSQFQFFVTPTDYFSKLNARLVDFNTDDIVLYAAYIATYQLGIISQLHNLPLLGLTFAFASGFNPYKSDTSYEYGLFEQSNKAARLQKFDKLRENVELRVAHLADFVADGEPIQPLNAKLSPAAAKYAAVGYDTSSFLTSSLVTPNKDRLVLQSITRSICLQDTVEKYPLAAGVLYEALHMTPEDSAEINAITKNVQSFFINRLQSNQIVQGADRDFAIKKVNNMNLVVGNVVQVKQAGYVANFYQASLAISSTDFYQNAIVNVQDINLVQFREFKLSLDLLTLSLFQDFTAVDAYYTPIFNTMVIPFGLMQNEAFSYLNPPAMNYGLYGFVVGHELSHAVDPTSSNYNEYGAPVASTMSVQATADIKTKLSAFKNFFTEFVIGGKPSASDTSPQTSADNGGLQAAWAAYKGVTAAGQPKVILPGKVSSLSQDALFFLNFGQLFCQSVDAEVKFDDHNNTANPYPIAEFRVNGAVSLLPQFATTYNCKTGTPMAQSSSSYTAQQCTLW